MRQINFGGIMDKDFAATITDEALNEATGEQLRKIAADAGLSVYDTHTTVLDVNLGPEVVGTPGALTALDKTVAAVVAAYKAAGREPQVTQRYGAAVQVMVWQEDSGVRSSIRWARDRVLKED
jgi:hypothetical protein